MAGYSFYDKNLDFSLFCLAFVEKEFSFAKHVPDCNILLSLYDILSLLDYFEI